MKILACSIVAAALVAAMPLMAPGASAGENFRFGLSVGSGHGYYGGNRHYGYRRHYRRPYGYRRHRSSRYYSGFTYYGSPRTYYYYSPYDRGRVYYGAPVQLAPPAGATATDPAAPKSTSQGYCREFTRKIIVDGAEQLAYGTACRQPDGTWRIMP